MIESYVRMFEYGVCIGKVRIFIRIDIRILPLRKSACPHIRILPVAWPNDIYAFPKVK